VFSTRGSGTGIKYKKNKKCLFIASVADPLIFTHSGSRIPDPKTATKERG